MDELIGRAEHDEFARRFDDENKRQNRRIEALEEAIRQSSALIANVERLAMNMETMAKEQERQGKRLEVLEARDGEMWRKAGVYAVTALIGIVIGYIFTHIGM